MERRVPGVEGLLAGKNLLVAGMGGDFNAYCGPPVYLELLSRA